jgi:DGQHR domain-containing protein
MAKISIPKRTIRCLSMTFGKVTFYSFPMRVKDLVQIYYVAVRGKDSEEGAVQRVLNKRRIESIKDFVLKGNSFFSTFILNWTDENFLPDTSKETIDLPIVKSAAQVIDGQHRLAGLEAALALQDEVGERNVLVSLCVGLSTAQAAGIFLNINSEQKPVPKSLIYDLFGEVEDDADHGIVRATDVAADLNENLESPFYKAIKYPGAPRGVGILDLSVVVGSLKDHLEPTGTFAKLKLRSISSQKQVIMNYFTALKSFYDAEGLWGNKAKNPFLKSSGFSGAIEHLTTTLLLKCADKKSFSVNFFRELLSLEDNLLLHQEIEGLDGKTARKKVKEYLESHLRESLPDQDEYEF